MDESTYLAYCQRLGKRPDPEIAGRQKSSLGDEPEDAFLAWVIRLFTQHGYLCYHTHDSRRSEPGFLDLVMTNGQETLFVETKTNIGKLTPQQQRWRALLEKAGQKVYVWRPRDKAMILDRVTWQRNE